MEEGSQGNNGGRRSRPESSSSKDTRMTPNGTGSSKDGSVRGGNANGNSRGTSLLQERLNQRKVESARKSRDVSGNGERGVQSSPVRGLREERRPSSSGVVPTAKGMGVKQMEEQVSTLHKQNFDLKLELYHRRQRQEGLETRLAAAEKQIAEQAEIMEMNEQLLAELERRDHALDEAVGVIVNLEEKVDRLMREREMVRSVDARFDAPYIHTEDLSSSPPEAKPESRSRNVVRMPSFLSERSEGTEALRSLYLPHNHSYSDATLPKLLEEGSMDGMNSPRLSVLSESSFLSVYGEKPLDLNAEPEDPRRHRASSSVEKWIDERPAATTPQRTSPDLLRSKKQFLSINDVLESPLQRLEKLKHTLEKASLPERSNSVKEKYKSREGPKRVFTDKASFEHQQTLPPTPDTISTSTLRHYKNSNDTLAADQTFLNITSAFTPGITYNAYQSALSMRPRSAGETVTSRREGHGWDTETQEDLTETGSIASTSSTYSAPYSNHTKRIQTPELFNFSTSDNRTEDWGRNIMFSEPEARLPPHNNKPYNTSLRRSSMVEHPRCDDTVVGPSYNTYHNRYAEIKRGATPIDTSPRPELPDRRSSLSAVSKLRKSNIPTATTTVNAGTSPASSNTTAASTNSTVKKSRLSSLLFRRGDQDPPSLSFPTSQHQKHEKAPPQPPAHGMTQRPKPYISTSTGNGRSNSYFEANEERECATPPPIRRSRTTATGQGYRPVSAGAGTGRTERERGFGGDGTDDGDFRFVAGAASANEKREKRASADLSSGLGSKTAGAESGGGGVEGEGKRKWFGGLRRG